jgi:DNA polymerase-3 subunit delta
VEKIVGVIPRDQRDFNLDRFHLPDSSLDEALLAARTLPFLSSRRIVLLQGLEKIGAASVDADLLERYLKEPVPETTLVLITEDAAAGRTWSKKLAGLCEVVVFKPLSGRSLPAAVGRFAQERNVRILPEAVERLVEEAGGDLTRLRQEVEKLSLFVGPGGQVGAAEVHLLVCGYAYQAMFEFVQSVCERDIRRSMMLAANLFEAGADPAGVVGMLAKRLRTIWYLAADDSGRTGSVPGAYRIQKWQLGDLRRQAAGFSRKEVESLLEKLFHIDRMVKSRPVSFRLLLEDFVLSLGGKASFPAPA